MKWTERVIGSLGERDATLAAGELLSAGLSRVTDLDELRDLLGAASVLLHADAMRGDLTLPPLDRALESLELLRGPDAETAVVGLGDAGRAVLRLLAAQQAPGLATRRFYVDVESSRARDAGEQTVHVILESAGDGQSSGVPRLGDVLRAAYRAAAGAGRPPALLAESLFGSSEARVTVHVVAGLEDPWTAVLPDFLLDLQSFLARSGRGRTVLHLLTRPSPRVRGSFLASIEELEKARPFNEAFILCASEEALPRKVVELIQLATRAPELLFQQSASIRGGAFASYGVAPAPAPPDGEQPVERYIRRLDEAYTAAAPMWMPGNAVLLELTAETTCYVHPPEAPPPEEAWRLCPSLTPVAVDGGEAMLCRIQRGLRLGDLRLA